MKSDAVRALQEPRKAIELQKLINVARLKHHKANAEILNRQVKSIRSELYRHVGDAIISSDTSNLTQTEKSLFNSVNSSFLKRRTKGAISRNRVKD